MICMYALQGELREEVYVEYGIMEFGCWDVMLKDFSFENFRRD
jgi:hypothetical protein